MKARPSLGLLLTLAFLAAFPASAAAELRIEPGDTILELLDAAGQPETRAGAHPDLLVQSFQLTDTGGAPEDLKQLVIELPPGLVGDPNAVPLCPRYKISVWAGSCPAASQVGRGRAPNGFRSPIYSVEPGPNEAATFAEEGVYKPQILSGRLRSEDQGLSLYLSDIESFGDSVTEGTIELWGVPADHQVGTGIPRRALLTMPTRCDQPPVSVTVKMRTWEQPGRWIQGAGDTGHPITGCAELRFDPRLDFSLERPRADVPSGARIDVLLSQGEDPDARVPSMIRGVSIEMPAGLTVSPAGAAALRACTDAQFGLGSGDDVACPAASRIGSVEMGAVALGRPMGGAIYLGEERPGERFRLLVAADAPGSVAKFAGSLRADPATGRLTALLADLPEAAFDRLTLRFDGGPGALLATPPACGPAATAAAFTPYSGGPTARWSGAVAVEPPTGGACGPLPFAPTFAGGSTNVRAGRSTSFTTTVRRRDGEQLPRRLAIALPAGLSAALGTVERCAAGQAQAGTCPAASRVGEAVAELGPGESPARLRGDVFLTGPHRGAPFGVAFELGGQLGPLRLGTLVVRGALRVDPFSGGVAVEMDTLPTIFEGIPIRFQTIGLDLDRPGFMRNPTSCRLGRAAATLRSEAGAVATPGTPFRVRGCVELPFRPDFSVALRGAEELRERGKPALRMSMRVPAGGANLRSVEVLLPRLLKLDPSGPKALCARRQALAGGCPASSQIGIAVARTPLLRRPMEGFLHLVQPADNGSPDLWAMLSGQGLEVNLRGETAVEEGRTTTRFAALPDFPLSFLRLRLAGGEDGLLRLRGAPCGRLLAPTEIDGQNGARRTLRARIAVPSQCRNDG